MDKGATLCDNISEVAVLRRKGNLESFQPYVCQPWVFSSVFSSELILIWSDYGADDWLHPFCKHFS